MVNTTIDDKSNSNGIKMTDNPEAIVKEFLKATQEDNGATLVLNGNGNGSKNLIFNSIVIQTTDQETSDLILDKIKGLSSEAFEEILLAIASQLKERGENKDKQNK